MDRSLYSTRPRMRGPSRRTFGVIALTMTAAVAPSLSGALGPGAGLSGAVAAETTCPRLSVSAAQQATATASYTAPWNRVTAVADGAVVFTGGAQDQLWGTYSGNRPAQQWLQYDWSGDGVLTGASMSFWSDAADDAGDGVAVPRAWRLQSWTDGVWQDIPLRDGAAYPRVKGATNTVVFAQPVTTSKLRAVFDAATNGSTFAAVGVSEFAVAGDVPPKPGAGTENLTSSAFNVAISRSTGGIYQLGNAADVPDCTNYVMNPSSRPAFDLNDSRWLGDVTMKVDGTPRVTGLSDDIRTVARTAEGVRVAYAGNAGNPNGIRGFDLTQDYKLTGAGGDVLDWSLKIDNTSGQQIEFQDLALPMLMNSWWNAGDQTGIYEQNVARHSFVAKDGSYIYWQRPNGVGPYLVMVPKSGTSIEFRDKARIGEGPFAENDPAWEGLVEFAIHSKALQPARAGKIEGYLPATSLTLGAGQSKTYGFTFRWADDYADLRDVLYEAGVVDVVSLPGMVIPRDQQATLAVRARDGIDAVVGQDGKNISVTPAGNRNGYSLYRLAFPTAGPNTVTVTYGGGRQSVLQYYSTERIDQLINTHADFLVTKQQAKTARGYDGSFLQWDMSRQKRVSWDDYPGGGWKEWMAGGSDDAGLSPALYLAQKNLIEPDQAQIAAIDYYIEEFILGYLQSRRENGERTWQVYRWFDGRDDTPNDQGVWRAYNYTHIANTYLAMYQVKTEYPQLTTKFTAKQYLEMAFKTLDAMYNKIPLPTPIGDAAHTLGLMGEGTYPELIGALRTEGMTSEADSLRSLVRAKSETMFAEEYPFASEASIDTTGFETSYTLAKMFGNGPMVEKVQRSSMASRGTQPLWYYYGGDNRHMGESWWNLGYEAHLGAWQQQDYLLNYADTTSPEFDESMRSTYGAYLAGWANINTGQISSAPANIGAASWQYQSQKGAGEGSNAYWGFMPMIDGWWAFSGEADLGFWGGLRTASVNVVEDRVVGLYAYGGDVDLRDGVYTITPKDGVQQRFTLYNKGRFGVTVDGAKYSRADVDSSLLDTKLTLTNEIGSTYSPTITIDNVPAGNYRVAVDGTTKPGTVSAVDGELVVSLDLQGATNSVRIWKDDSAPVVTVPADQSVKASSAAGAPVTYAASATDNVDGTVPVTCLPPSGSTIPVGTTKVTCEATDAAGNVGRASFNVTVSSAGAAPDNVAPVLEVPANLSVKATSSSGATVTFAASASDNVDGAVPVTCVPKSGSTFPIGVTKVSCTATDVAGNTGTAAFQAKVSYSGKGFLAPINNLDRNGNLILNKTNPGSTVPVKFRLGGYFGRSVLASVTSSSISCGSRSTIDNIESLAPTRTRGLKYSRKNGKYTFNWKTEKSYTGCRQLRMELADGSVRIANFKFSK